MTYIKKSGADREVMKQKAMRRQIRRGEDIRSGLTRTSEAQRGDYKFCKESDKVLKDYRRFAHDPKARQKIQDEYYGRQAEERKRIQHKYI